MSNTLKTKDHGLPLDFDLDKLESHEGTSSSTGVEGPRLLTVLDGYSSGGQPSIQQVSRPPRRTVSIAANQPIPLRINVHHERLTISHLLNIVSILHGLSNKIPLLLQKILLYCFDMKAYASCNAQWFLQSNGKVPG